MNVSTKKQRKPQNKTDIDIVDLVKNDLDSRAIEGEKRYGVRLRAFNGRNALIDAYQEALDLAMYLRQELEERINQ
jgi:hypothetical protein